MNTLELTTLVMRDLEKEVPGTDELLELDILESEMVGQRALLFSFSHIYDESNLEADHDDIIMSIEEVLGDEWGYAGKYVTDMLWTYQFFPKDVIRKLRA